MPYELEHRLVIGVASSALFDLTESDHVFRDHGEEAYRAFQEEHLDDPLHPGVAFSFIRRLLTLNDLSAEASDPLVEVIVLSKNDPDTGLRVMRSIDHHTLPVTRAVFMRGKSPYEFMPVLHMSLFLTANANDVREATGMGLPAGRVVGSAVPDDRIDSNVRIAFDFDGVLADDASEQIFQSKGLDEFQRHEMTNAVTPHRPGPLKDLLAKINKIQKREEQVMASDPDYERRLRVAIVTSRNAPAHERAVLSLKGWGVTVDDAFFLGGIAKGPIIETLRPDIFFDDQEPHLQEASVTAPCVHIPYGELNQAVATDLSLPRQVHRQMGAALPDDVTASDGDSATR